MEMQGKLDARAFLDDWPVFFMILIPLGLVGGGSDILSSRFLVVYSSFPVSAISLLVMAAEIPDHDGPISLMTTSASNLHLVLNLMVIGFWYYSVFISYKGVSILTGLTSGKLKLWFLYLPILYYTMSLGTVAVLYAYLM